VILFNNNKKGKDNTNIIYITLHGMYQFTNEVPSFF